MKRAINRNTLTLQQQAQPATAMDGQVVNDLADTLRAHSDEAVGMAANMIGENKRIIALFVGPIVVTMLNPTITAKTGAYQATEGCLSLTGERETTRYNSITVSYQDAQFNQHQQTFKDFTAEIIQHEVDHCDGILI